MTGLLDKGFLLAVLASITGMIVIGIVRPLIVFDVLEEQSLFYVSLLTASFMTARGLSSLATGYALPRRGPGVIASMALLLWCTAIYLYMVLPPATYPYIKIIEGVSAGLLWPAMQVVVVERVGHGLRNTGLSIYFVAGSLAYNAGICLGGVIISLYGKASAYTVSITTLLALAVILYTMLPRRGASGGAAGGLRRYLSIIPLLGPVIPLAVIAGGLGGLMLDYIMAYAKENLGLSRVDMRLYWSYAGYLALALSLVVSRLADKYGGGKLTVIVSYISIAPLALTVLDMPPLLYFTILSLPLIGQKTLKPLLRGYAVERAGSAAESVPAVNFVSNVSAALLTVLIAYLVDTLGAASVYVIPGFTVAALALLTLSLYAWRR